MADGPTLDSELYSFATMRLEHHAVDRIERAIDKEALSRWFGEGLRTAYQAGLRDGYVQGRHDDHKEAVVTDAPIEFTNARCWAAEGARVGLVTCLRCGAALLIDSTDEKDALGLHREWHAALGTVWARESGTEL